MKLFTALGANINYRDPIQLDGAFPSQHTLYEKNPAFSDITASSPSKKLDLESDNRKRLELWKHFWLEYIDSFDALTTARPDSVATAYLGGHAVELGFKYLLLAKTNSFIRTHDLAALAKEVNNEYGPLPTYCDWIVDFCTLYQTYVEEGHIEYFRYPEYGGTADGPLIQRHEVGHSLDFIQPRAHYAQATTSCRSRKLITSIAQSWIAATQHGNYR